MGFSTIYTANLAALTKSTNVLAGDVNEFVPNGGVVTFYGVSSAIGIKLSIYVDGELVIDDKEIPFIGTSLIKKDHFFDSVVVEAGSRLAVYLRETANVATTDIYIGVETE